ncbi:FxsA family protein [Haloarculaceae archaeon H-GB2-1]|nr:membrane protein FxsA [Haloarculaceae archaeon H-GB1-1]MEA5406622.1 FxsA family protein [Haloarculaceae archaeon H-GB2-1]
MFRVLAALLAIPLLDALLLVAVAGQIGGLPTVLLVVLTALVGTLLVRAEGRHTLRTIQRKLAAGEVPADELMDGGLLIAAGAFALTPGLVTDAVALLLVVPVTRYPIRLALKKYVVVPYLDDQTGGFTTGNVYIGGFPGGDDGDGFPGGVGGGFQGGGSTTSRSSDDVYDIDDDAYSIDFEDDGRSTDT